MKQPTLLAYKSQGFSLMEWLVASALASLIATLVIKIAFNIQASEKLQQALANIQQQGRFVIHRINSAIRSSGNHLCVSKSRQLAPAIEGFASGNIPASWSIQPKFHTDVIVIASCLPYKGRLRYQRQVFYIKTTKRHTITGEKIDALYEKILGLRAVELAEGIDNLTFSYGLTDNKGCNVQRYVPATLVKNWGRVLSIEWQIKLNAINGVKQSKNRPLSKVWHTYVTLWGRIPCKK